MAENSVLFGNFDSKTKEIIINSYGSWKLGNLNVSFAIKKSKKVIVLGTITAWVKISVPSSSIFLPIPYYFDITLNSFLDGTSAIVDALNQDFKLLPGSSLSIKKGVTLNANKIAIYGQADLYPNGKSIETGDLGSSQYPNQSDAILENYGNISASAIGGNVSNYNGSISATVTSVQSKEAHDFTKTTIKVTLVISVNVDIYIPSYDPLINLTLKIIES